MRKESPPRKPYTPKHLLPNSPTVACRVSIATRKTLEEIVAAKSSSLTVILQAAINEYIKKEKPQGGASL